MGSECVTSKTVDGVALKGDFFRAGSSSSPGIVMAQGLSVLKEHYIEDTARRFQEAGIAALVYDHRGYGSSGGHPRHQTDPLQQATPRPGSRSRTSAAPARFTGTSSASRLPPRGPEACFTSRGDVEFELFQSAGQLPGTFTHMGWTVPDLDAEVAELRSGAVFEEYVFPGLKTEGGIAFTEGGYASKGARAARGAGFATARATCSASSSSCRDRQAAAQPAWCSSPRPGRMD
jgi:hypothetical protein